MKVGKGQKKGSALLVLRGVFEESFVEPFCLLPTLLCRKAAARSPAVGCPLNSVVIIQITPGNNNTLAGYMLCMVKGGFAFRARQSCRYLRKVRKYLNHGGCAGLLADVFLQLKRILIQ